MAVFAQASIGLWQPLRKCVVSPARLQAPRHCPRRIKGDSVVTFSRLALSFRICFTLLKQHRPHLEPCINLSTISEHGVILGWSIMVRQLMKFGQIPILK